MMRRSGLSHPLNLFIRSFVFRAAAGYSAIYCVYAFCVDVGLSDIMLEALP